MDQKRQTNQIILKKIKEGPSLFPKLSKVQVTPIVKSVGKKMQKKYGGQSIFKHKPQKTQIKCLKMSYDQDYQIQNEINVSRKRHIQEMEKLQKVNQEKRILIEQKKKKSYEAKLSLWELKNQILQLKATLKDQEQLYDKLIQDIQYDEVQGQESHYQDNRGEQQQSISPPEEKFSKESSNL